MSLTPGEATAVLAVLTTAALGIWGQLGKGRESLQAREDRLRAEKDARIAALELHITQLQAQKVAVEQERDNGEETNSDLRRRLDTLLDFLRDVVGESYAVEWIRRRATELLKRMAP